jgi:deoxyribose-phosphate aldolase
MKHFPPILNELHRRFDHAALQAEVNEDVVRALCAEAIEFDLFAVVINPIWVALAADILKGHRSKVVSVAGFPLGANRPDIKVAESVEAVEDGAEEIDLVANIGWLVSGQFVDVETEIRKVRRQLPSGILLKVIIESGKLTEQQQIDATSAVISGGAQFVKTSTGFFGGATVEQVRTLHLAARSLVEVKASGGIKSVADCQSLLEAGASRLGASSSAAILRQFKQLYGS